MRAPRLPLIASAALSLTACASTPTGPSAPPPGYGCHTEGGAGGGKSAALDPGVMTGLGDMGFAAEHVGDEAAPYYGEAVRLTHAFNAWDAIRAAKVAERLQPDCALCFWAQSWASGPTINYSIDAKEEGEGRTAALKAQALSTGLSDKSKGLIAAQLVRYPATPRSKDPASDDKAYADAMARLADRYPQDDALSVEAASALLVASGRAWSEGVPKPGSDAAKAQTRLEAVLARSPDYTPAIHFYIHLMEWTHSPEKAAPYAERLGRLAPNAGHLVHMPSHLWFRMGRYEAGADANTAAALADDRATVALKVDGGVGKFALHGHNVSFGLASALMSGDRDQAVALARRVTTEFPKSAGMNLKAYQAYARELPLDQALAVPEPADAAVKPVWRYGRALARLNGGDVAGAVAERDAFKTAAASQGKDKQTRQGLALMETELDGRIALAQGRLDDAVRLLRRAADDRDRFDNGMDPPMWGWPPRRLLAVALLKKGDAAGAATELDRNLGRFKNDPLALHLLAEAKRKLGAGAEADRLQAQALAAWKGAPSDLTARRA